MRPPAASAAAEPGTIDGYHDPRNGAILLGAACKADCKADEVTQCGKKQRITGFSSRGSADGTGPQVDVAAPGDSIMAALSPSVLTPLTECAEAQTPGYFCISGTSMAAPHVAGVVALMLQANPQAKPGQVKRCLRSTADDMLARGFDIHSGRGMVDAEAAVNCAHALSLGKRR